MTGQNGEDTRGGQRPKVTIFGAGIAGLTAAHELAMRGFTVQVIDPAYNAESTANSFERGVGGMARSQWAIAASGTLSGPTPMLRLWSGSELLHNVAIRFDDGKPDDLTRAKQILERLYEAICALRAASVPPAAITVRVHSPARVPRDQLLADPRVLYIKEFLLERRVNEADVDDMFMRWKGDVNEISFTQQGAVAPAEHGFRFFPSFYRHLFDTMRRTPILSPRDAERTKATAFQNLVPSEGLGFARSGKAVSFMVPRRAMSMEAVRKVLQQVLDKLGYTGSDIARFSLKLFKYMTSCSERRCEGYEHTSWGDFLEAWRYSEISRTHIEYGPQMSAALRGSASDARTQGNITVQLLLDQLKPDALADYTLSGPTSAYWLDHWHDFLVDEGVTFERGELLGFERDGEHIKPKVAGPKVTGEFFILALSLPAMVPLANDFLSVAKRVCRESELDDMRKVVEFAGDLTTLQTATPSGPLQHLSGIQFYFDYDIRFWRGHNQYLDSEWGLTSIAQPQFWARFRIPEDGYYSILSVDIGIFDRPYKPNGDAPAKTAWQCTADEIAKYTWEQIHAHHDDAFRKRYGKAAQIPTPVAYALDGTLSFQGDRNGALHRNGSPFLVNKTGAYPTRPGRLNTRRGRSKCISRYDVIAGHYVLAGTFMQTFTRLTSMESANESARHAVNALLQVFRIPGDRCDIWDPEDHELDDLQWFKDLDEEMFARGVPHFVDILGWNELPDQLDQLHTLAQRFVRDRDHSTRRRAHDDEV